ncbi:hypothetical protein NZD89_27965 (plasmid) [Alicyclobacillus fastidiosus]|uniref:Uncharacterized protein n=1 Tax=Alicyclobacillus fastidiosus TaxID=392011 RepID=A0ABY6ZRW1_9BACL|nr:hypothetical protein [Alicyclobacillus fastidiosus]WAH44886.1 hypothetical protein NZD89_27965 [Alicyclobacillus fastidiosus]
MAKHTFELTTEASAMLKQYRENRRSLGVKVSYNDIASEAIKLYCLSQQRDRAEEIFEKAMEHRFQKFESRLASMVAAVGVDVAMILSETLETIAAYEENQGKKYQDIYQELRQEGVALFNRHRAFKLDAFK